MKHFSRLVAGLCFILLLTTCKKARYYSLDATPILKDACTFKEGSYFVYQDSLIGATDSFWVTNFSDVIINGVERDKNTYEWMQYSMWNGLDGRIGLAIQASSNAVKTVRGGYNKYNMAFFTYPFQIGNSYIEDVDRYWLINYQAQALVKGNYYKNVYTTAGVGKATSFDDSLHYTIYYSPQSGLVKWEVSGDTIHHIWELIRNRVVK